MNFQHSLEDYLRQKYGPVKVSGLDLCIDCPHCVTRGKGQDTGHNLWVANKPGKVGVARCWRCGWAGVILPPGASRRTSSKGSEPRPVNLQVIDAANVPEIPMADGYHALKKGCSPYLKRFVKYLDSRGVDLKTAERYQIGACITGRYQGMLILPITYLGKLVYWTSRRVYGDGPKNINPPKLGEDSLGKSAFLYGWDQINPRKSVALVEGPFDTLTTPNALGGMGKEYSDTQIYMLAQLNAPEYVVMLDPDASKYAAKLAYALRQYDLNVKIVNLTKGDPNDNRQHIEGWLELADRVTLASILKQKLRK